MSDDNKEINEDIKEIHGIEVDSNGHDRALRHLEKHVNREQLHEMVHNAKHSVDHNSHFTAKVDGHDVEYKLEYHHGNVKVGKVHHS